jgi:hypothetical protein
MQSPVSALSTLLSMIEYATKPVLTDIVKRHKCNYHWKRIGKCCALLLHLTYHWANSDADGCITSFYMPLRFKYRPQFYILLDCDLDCDLFEACHT